MKEKRICLRREQVFVLILAAPFFLALLLMVGTPMLYQFTENDLEGALGELQAQQREGGMTGRRVSESYDWGYIRMEDWAQEVFFQADQWTGTIRPLQYGTEEIWWEMALPGEYSCLKVYPESGLALLSMDNLHYKWFQMPPALQQSGGGYLHLERPE